MWTTCSIQHEQRVVVVDEEIMMRLKEDEQVYQHFINFPELYLRIRIDTIQSVREDQKTYLRQLDKLIEKTKVNEMYGQWNDDGVMEKGVVFPIKTTPGYDQSSVSDYTSQYFQRTQRVLRRKEA